MIKPFREPRVGALTRLGHGREANKGPRDATPWIDWRTGRVRTHATRFVARSPTSSPPVRPVEINERPARHDPARVHPQMALEVVPLDVLEVDRPCDPRVLVQIAGVRPQVRIVREPPQIALEVVVVH